MTADKVLAILLLGVMIITPVGLIVWALQQTLRVYMIRSYAADLRLQEADIRRREQRVYERETALHAKEIELIRREISQSNH